MIFFCWNFQCLLTRKELFFAGSLVISRIYRIKVVHFKSHSIFFCDIPMPICFHFLSNIFFYFVKNKEKKQQKFQSTFDVSQFLWILDLHNLDESRIFQMNWIKCKTFKRKTCNYVKKKIENFIKICKGEFRMQKNIEQTIFFSTAVQFYFWLLFIYSTSCCILIDSHHATCDYH